MNFIKFFPQILRIKVDSSRWFHMGEFDADIKTDYTCNKSGNGLYLFVLEGEVKVGDSVLGRRDALGITEANQIHVRTSKNPKFS